MDRAVQAREYLVQVDASPWIDDATWDRAVSTLIRTSEWFPTVRDLLRACADTERDLRHADERDAVQEPGPDEATAIVRSLHGGSGSQSDGLRRAVENGTWDRGWVYGAMSLRLQRKPTSNELDDGLRRVASGQHPMGEDANGRRGSSRLRGKLEAALTARLPEEG